MAVKRFAGAVEFVRLDIERLERLVGPEYEELERERDLFGHPDAVVCGKNDFEKLVYESLVDELGVVEHLHVTMLPSDGFVTAN
ncbi:hypothetical protein HK098_006027 [Nowakowskiella sp. JEL0407]|nr:hypothetical protein HK098_006027 [Nowakowskiella sp. JEL0407]